MIQTNRDEINKLIIEKCEIEQKYQDHKVLLTKIKGMLKQKEEFRKLEDLVNKIQSALVLKSTSNFTDLDKQIIRELFGIKDEGALLSEG